MIKNIIFATALLFGAMAVVGCSKNSSDPAADTVSATLMSKQGQLIAKIEDPIKVSKVLQIIETKSTLKEKLMPIFEYQLHISNQQGKQKWLFTTNGYIQDVSSSDGKIYRLKGANKIVEIITLK